MVAVSEPTQPEDLAGLLHYDHTAFMAHRRRVASTISVDPPTSYALPGALAPIATDRLKAHQETYGLREHEIVRYENERFLEQNATVREKHARWVRRDYDAMVKVERQMKAERQAKELKAAAEYQSRLADMLARKDAGNT